LWTETPDHEDIPSLQASIATLVSACQIWDSEKLPLAGCVISVHHDGKAVTAIGVVTPADQRKINRIDARRAHEKAKAEANRRREKEHVEAEPTPDNPPATATDVIRASPDGVTVIVIDPAAGSVSIASQSDGDATPLTEAIPNSEAVMDGNAPTITTEERSPWEDDEPKPANISGYTQKTLNDLTAACTRAIRAHLSTAPDVALALSVYGLGYQFMAMTGPIGMAVHAFVCLSNVDTDPLASKRDTLNALDLHEARWLDWCLSQGAQALLDTQATLIASTLDLSYTGTTPNCRRKQEMADTLATRLQVDMTNWWTPITDFFIGLTKAQIADAILQSPAAMALLSEKDKKAFEATLGAKRKDELALIAARSLEGAGWLPGVIQTSGLVNVTDPDAEPAFEVTDERLEALVAAEAVEP